MSTLTPQDELTAAKEKEMNLRYKRRLAADEIERLRRMVAIYDDKIRAAHAEVIAAESAVRHAPFEWITSDGKGCFTFGPLQRCPDCFNPIPCDCEGRL